MSITLTQNTKKLDRSLWVGDLQLLEKNEAYKELIKRISEKRHEAMYHVLAVDVESKMWRSRLNTFDEVLGILDEIKAESLESKRQQEEKDE